MTNIDPRITALNIDPTAIFTFYDDNSDYLTGKTQVPIVTRGTKGQVMLFSGVVIIVTCVFIILLSSGMSHPDPQLFLMIIPALIGVAFLFYAVRLMQVNVQRERAWTTATLVLGKVINYSSAFQKQNYLVTLVYSYQLPDSDQTVTMTDTRQYNPNERSIWEKNLPEPGALVLIGLYKNPIRPANPFGRTTFNSIRL